jgi:serine/threonine protein phosphatase PrpC
MPGDYAEQYKEGVVNIGMAEIQGRRDAQEDALVVAVEEVKFFPTLAESSQAQVLTNTLKHIQRMHEYAYSGSTANATVAWLDDAGVVQTVTANLGDSTSYLIIVDSENNLVSSELLNALHTADFAENPAEHARVMQFAQENSVAKPSKEARGHPWRLGSGLAMTRSLGDMGSEAFGLSHEPDVSRKSVALLPDQQAFIVVACDGLTEGDLEEVPVFTPESIGDLVATANINLATLANFLVRNAYLLGSHDNISVAVFAVSDQPTSAAIFDGHGGDEVALSAGNEFYFELQNQIYKQRDFTLLERQEYEDKMAFIRSTNEVPPSPLIDSDDYSDDSDDSSDDSKITRTLSSASLSFTDYSATSQPISYEEQSDFTLMVNDLNIIGEDFANLPNIDGLFNVTVQKSIGRALKELVAANMTELTVLQTLLRLFNVDDNVRIAKIASEVMCVVTEYPPFEALAGDKFDERRLTPAIMKEHLTAMINEFELQQIARPTIV